MALVEALLRTAASVSAHYNKRALLRALYVTRELFMLYGNNHHFLCQTRPSSCQHDPALRGSVSYTVQLIGLPSHRSKWRHANVTHLGVDIDSLGKPCSVSETKQNKHTASRDSPRPMMASVAVLCHQPNASIMIMFTDVCLCSHFHAPVIACFIISLHHPRYGR